MTAAVATAAGCAGANPPTPEVSARASFPVRPIELSVDPVDPCAMLSGPQSTRLGVLRISGSSVETVDDRPSRGCTWIADGSADGPAEQPAVNYNVQVIPLPAERAASADGAVVTQVDGFGAVSNVPPSLAGSLVCQVAVDAAQDRTLRIQAVLPPVGPQLPVDEVCRRAADAASMVVTTVSASSR